jgi:hypothetical protein
VADPDKAVIVPFTIKVPRDATPGDHAGGIIASITRRVVGRHGAHIRIEQRVGARVYARVAGQLRPRLVISGITTHYAGTLSPFAGGTLTVTYAIRNVGNLDLRAPAVLRLTNPFGWSRTVPRSGYPSDVLPGFSVEHTSVIQGVYPAFRVGATVTVSPHFSVVSTLNGMNVTSVRLHDVSAGAGTWAIPWPLLVLALLVILVLALALYAYSRSRRRRRGDQKEEPTPARVAVPV